MGLEQFIPESPDTQPEQAFEIQAPDEVAYMTLGWLYAHRESKYVKSKRIARDTGNPPKQIGLVLSWLEEVERWDTSSTSTGTWVNPFYLD